MCFIGVSVGVEFAYLITILNINVCVLSYQFPRFMLSGNSIAFHNFPSNLFTTCGGVGGTAAQRSP